MAPVPAPISSTGVLPGPMREAMKRESLGELGTTAPTPFGLISRERKKSKRARAGIGFTLQSRMAA